MPTDSDFALITDKKLLGVRDFDLWLLKYLRDYINQGVKRLFIQGSFKERMPLSSEGANQVQVDLKPTLLDGVAHDGAGHILDLEPINRTAFFENVNGQLYEVGASYVEYPVGIRTNPRTGKFEYDRMREGIGVAAEPDSVQVDTSTLTFVIDSLFEQGVTVANHSGRMVRVFMLQPGDRASSEAIAIETCTSFYDGQNKITTTGLLGQSTPQTNTSFYIVQLIGISVLMNTATNAPSQLPESVFFVGTVLGNGGGPDTFDISGQQVIEAQSADMITVDALGNWADGTANPGGTLQDVLEKIISDLTSTVDQRGAGKLTSPALGTWWDGITIDENTLALQLQQVITDLSTLVGDLETSGAQKISSGFLGTWADGETVSSGSVYDQLSAIVSALTDPNTGDGGTGKIISKDLPAWADGDPNPEANLHVMLTKLVSDLATTGALKVMAGDVNYPPLGVDDPISIQGDSIQNIFSGLAFYLNTEIVAQKQRNEAHAVHSLRRVYTNPSWTIQSIAGSVNSLGSTASLVAVGDNDTLLTRIQGGEWTKRTIAGGAIDFKSVVNGTLGWVIVGDSGNIQTSSDTIGWTSRKTGGPRLNDVAYKASSTATYCAVGEGGHVWTSTNLTTWTQRTAAAGMTGDNFVAITVGKGRGAGSFDPDLFVVTTDNGKVMTSPDGITWTQRTTLSGTTPKFLTRQLQNNRQFGFVALFTRNSDTEIGLAHSDDGITWSASTSSLIPNTNEDTIRLALLERSMIFFLMTNITIPPYSLSAIQQADLSFRPSVSGVGQNFFDLGECFPFRAANINGTLYVVGRADNGDGCILSGAPITPQSPLFGS